MTYYGGGAATGGSGSGGPAQSPTDFFTSPADGNPGLLRAFPRWAMPNTFNAITQWAVNVSSTGGAGDGVSLVGGGAGGGGGVIAIYAQTCSGTLTIQATGGVGATGPGTDLGGGAGGPGGLIIFVTSDINGANNYTFNLNGGLGGVGGGGLGTAGSTGGTGILYLIAN